MRVVVQRPDYNQRFVNTREQWFDDDMFLESNDQRLPLDLFASQEVEAIFSQHVKALQAEVKRQECVYMKALLNSISVALILQYLFADIYIGLAIVGL